MTDETLLTSQEVLVTSITSGTRGERGTIAYIFFNGSEHQIECDVETARRFHYNDRVRIEYHLVKEASEPKQLSESGPEDQRGPLNAIQTALFSFSHLFKEEPWMEHAAIGCMYNPMKQNDVITVSVDEGVDTAGVVTLYRGFEVQVLRRNTVEVDPKV